MGDNCDMLWGKYLGKFQYLETSWSWDYDVQVNCECGTELRLYIADPMRCNNCGRVYRIRTIVDRGDKVITDKEYEIMTEEWNKKQKATEKAMEEWRKNK